MLLTRTIAGVLVMVVVVVLEVEGAGRRAGSRVGRPV
jgi:hypothetical protein